MISFKGNIPDEAVTSLILVRTYIRLLRLNKSVYPREEQKQRKRSKKMQKFTIGTATSVHFRYAYQLIIYINNVNLVLKYNSSSKYVNRNL